MARKGEMRSLVVGMVRSKIISTSLGKIGSGRGREPQTHRDPRGYFS